MLTYADLNGFLLHLKIEADYSALTVERYRQVLTHLITQQTPMSVEGIAGFVATRLDGQPCASRNRNQRLSIVRTFCRYLVQQGRLVASPADTLKRSPIKKTPRPVVGFALLCQLRGALLQEPESRWRQRDEAMLALLFYVGLRVSELVRLNTDQIDTNNHRLRAVLRKGGDLRDSPLHPDAAAALYAWLLSHPSSKTESVFIGRWKQTRMTVRAVQKRLKVLASNAGISPEDVTPHAFRRGHATELRRSGVSTAYIKESMNHRSIKTTEVYFDDCSVEELRPFIEQLPSWKTTPHQDLSHPN